MKKILPFFSYLFHPIFISVYTAIFYFLTSDKYYVYDSVFLYMIQILIMTVFIPLACFYVLIYTKKVDSLMIENVSQRAIPLVIHIVLLAILINQSITKANIPELYYFFIGSIVSTLLALIMVFFKLKASLHMLSISSFTVFCIICSICFQSYTSIYFISTLIICNGLVASSRLYMKAHTITELTLGFCIGSIPQVIVLLYFL